MCDTENIHPFRRLICHWFAGLLCGLAVCSGLLASNAGLFEYVAWFTVRFASLQCDGGAVIDPGGFFFKSSFPPVQTQSNRIHWTIRQTRWVFPEERFEAATYCGTRLIQVPGLRLDRFCRERWGSGTFIRGVEVRARYWFVSSLCTICLAAMSLAQRRRHRFVMA